MLTDSQNTGEEQYSSYLQYLPALYREDDFTGRFLRIFEDIIDPVEGTINNLHFYFDPGTTPESFIPWLASWVGLVLDERWPEARRQELINSAVELYRWQGTKRGLSQYLKIYTGVMPEIIEHTYTPPVHSESNTQPGTSEPEGEKSQAFCFSVILNVPDAAKINIDIVRTIIETEKPAHTTYLLKTS